MTDEQKQNELNTIESKPSILTHIYNHAEAHKEAIIIIAAFFVFGFVIVTIAISFWEHRLDKMTSVQTVPIPIRVDQPQEKKAEPLAPYRQFDTSDWTNYTNQWYGFSLKYPKDWAKPQMVKGPTTKKWEYRYAFRPANQTDSGDQRGFDVVIYSVRTIKQLRNTEEYPKVKPGKEEDAACSNLDGHLIAHPEFTAEEVRTPTDDECYQPGFFFTLTNEQYIYNFIPAAAPTTAPEKETPADPYLQTIQSFPEFFDVATSINLITIVRPKPKPASPKITAPMPAWFKKDAQGRRVCAKKNDKPSKSDKNKKKYLDMECCLDPDEYPNPHCYYPPKKYGKYL